MSVPLRLRSGNGQSGERPPTSEIDGFDGLAALALDLSISWNQETASIWRDLDPELWERTHNPWAVLQTISREKLSVALGEPVFRQKADTLLRSKHAADQAPGWFQKTYPSHALKAVAYFSMEFMLSEALPIYSGGLGNVAGDQLKAANDLGVPVMGIGLLYQQGYFRQMIDREGAQQALFPYNDPGQLPVTPLRLSDGEWLRLEIALPGYSVWLRAWQVQVGGVMLYLLDSNDAANDPAHRGITSQLYGGGSELRLQQELVLGIGGWRLLEALGVAPEVCHLNEGHAAFAVLERAHQFMRASGQNFEVALTVTRAGNLFTTHTAVAAGFDRFSPALIAQYLGVYAAQKLGITLDDLLALGRQNPADPFEYFNMAYLAMRGSGAANAVSALHGEVSRRLFQPLFPRWPQDEVPIGHVTNGVHMRSWASAAAGALWRQACGDDCWLGTSENPGQKMQDVSGPELWKFRNAGRAALIGYARKRLARQLSGSGASAEAVAAAGRLFDPNALTLGFARRFATYKRPDLLLRDRARLMRILANPERPVQLIIAGKAHPDDRPGQALIQEWVRFIRQPEIRPHVIFLSDYDMLLTAQLVQGVDVWLNTPRRPWEACGTSGMKVLVNGGINLSERDGWWAEAYAPELGWALGDGSEHGDDPALDAVDADALYDVLEREVVPEFYARDETGLPTQWVERMRQSMARLTPRFSTSRSEQEYTQQYYLPAAAAYRARAANRGAAGMSLNDWRRNIAQNWDKLRFRAVTYETINGEHVFEIEVELGDLDPQAVQMELYAEPSGGPGLRQKLTQIRQSAGPDGCCRYQGSVPASRPASDYTARMLPYAEAARIPLECTKILWQR